MTSTTNPTDHDTPTRPGHPLQEQIRRELRTVDPEQFHPAQQAETRIEFLAQYLRDTGTRGLVLGISGGVDSTTAGRLAQLACERTGTTFTAVRLPYRTQSDEADAQSALTFIEAHEVVTVDIGFATDSVSSALHMQDPLWRALPPGTLDFHTGNIRARIRMLVQYALAGARGALVVSTDHGAEAVSGFFTKWGDGAADIAPLAGLTKGQVRAVAAHLGAPAELIAKVPTADLEVLRPGLADEDALGVSYADIDAYLEGRQVSDDTARRIEERYVATEHKRHMPVTP